MLIGTILHFYRAKTSQSLLMVRQHLENTTKHIFLKMPDLPLPVLHPVRLHSFSRLVLRK